MINLQDPFYPTPYTNSDRSVDYLNGVTKRECFAAMILQAILSNQKLREDCRSDIKADGTNSDNCFATYAVKQADELLKALNK